MSKTCSVCGGKPAVCVDRKRKGTYWLCGDCAGERIEELIGLHAHNEAVKEVVNEQAEDGGLWFIASTAPEAYLQSALRRLHTLIEGDVMTAPAAGEEER